MSAGILALCLRLAGRGLGVLVRTGRLRGASIGRRRRRLIGLSRVFTLRTFVRQAKSMFWSMVMDFDSLLMDYDGF